MNNFKKMPEQLTKPPKLSGRFCRDANVPYREKEGNFTAELVDYDNNTVARIWEDSQCEPESNTFVFRHNVVSFIPERAVIRELRGDPVCADGSYLVIDCNTALPAVTYTNGISDRKLRYRLGEEDGSYSLYPEFNALKLNNKGEQFFIKEDQFLRAEATFDEKLAIDN